MNGDPNSIYARFIDEFKTFKYWVWDSFEFSTMTVDQAVELEAPNHVLYDPQEDEFDYLPVVTFTPEEEFDDHKVYAVYIYDETENSYFVTKFASDTGLIRISSESHGDCYRHYYQKNVFYRKVMDHSIDFFNLNENPHVCKNSFKDFHLIPVLRPWNNQGPLNLLSASIPNTDRRIDISSRLQEDKKRGIPTGEWEFYIDHEKWESWTACYRALVHYFHGFKMAVRLKDHELDRIYQGRITVKNYAPGNDYSKIILEYQLFQDQVSDPSKLGLCFQVWWLDWDRRPVSYETIQWAAKPSSSSTSEGTNYTPNPRSAFDNQTFTPDLPVRIEILSLPSKLSYYSGDTIDYSGITVRAYNSKGTIWSANSRYLSGMIPYSELSFPVSIASLPYSVSSYYTQMIPVNWPRIEDSRILSSSYSIIVKMMIDSNIEIDSIFINTFPDKLSYKEGELIDITGLTIIAYRKITKKDGTPDLIPWTNDGEFQGGIIPTSKIINTVKNASYITNPEIESIQQIIPIQYTNPNSGMIHSTHFGIEVLSSLYGLDDLTKWTAENLAGLSITFTNEESNVTGEMTSGYYEKVYKEVNVEKDTNYSFSLHFSSTGFTENNRLGTHTYIAVISELPPGRGYIEDYESIVISKTQITGDGTYIVDFNSGNFERVYLLIDWAAMTDDEYVELSYSNIQFTKGEP